VGALAFLAIFGVHLWEQLPSLEADEPAGNPGWSVASRSCPAFAVSQLDFPEKTVTYEILQHPEGDRKDILRWAVQGEKPAAGLEIYHLGGEFDPSRPPAAELAVRMDLKGAIEQALIAPPAKMLVFMQLFRDPLHYCDRVWPD
jgi:hypothetical protein